VRIASFFYTKKQTGPACARGPINAAHAGSRGPRIGSWSHSLNSPPMTVVNDDGGGLEMRGRIWLDAV
jgi:hypothetical protein